MALKSGNVLVLTREDVTEGLLEGAILNIPAGCTRLMLRDRDREDLNTDLGYDQEAD